MTLSDTSSNTSTTNKRHFTEEKIYGIIKKSWEAYCPKSQNVMGFNNAKPALQRCITQFAPVAPTPREEWYKTVFKNFDTDYDGLINFAAFDDIIQQYFNHHLGRYLKKQDKLQKQMTASYLSSKDGDQRFRRQEFDSECYFTCLDDSVSDDLEAPCDVELRHVELPRYVVESVCHRSRNPTRYTGKRSTLKDFVKNLFADVTDAAKRKHSLPESFITSTTGTAGGIFGGGGGYVVEGNPIEFRVEDPPYVLAAYNQQYPFSPDVNHCSTEVPRSSERRISSDNPTSSQLAPSSGVPFNSETRPFSLHAPSSDVPTSETYCHTYSQRLESTESDDTFTPAPGLQTQKSKRMENLDDEADDDDDNDDPFIPVPVSLPASLPVSVAEKQQSARISERISYEKCAKQSEEELEVLNNKVITASVDAEEHVPMPRRNTVPELDGQTEQRMVTKKKRTKKRGPIEFREEGFFDGMKNLLFCCCISVAPVETEEMRLMRRLR